MSQEPVKLTAKFKLKEAPEWLNELFSIYRGMVNLLITQAFENRITSFKRLRMENYEKLRESHPELPSHYIYTACQMACSIYKSFRKLRRRGKARSEKPLFRRDAIMLDDHLFRVDLENWTLSLATLRGRVELGLLHSEYHEKFRSWKAGQAWLLRNSKGFFLSVVFSKNVEIKEPEDFVGVDLNENNATLTLPDEEFVQITTHEREIRTGYYLKRRRIQKKLGASKKRDRLLKKYGERERNRLNDLYHKLANKIVELAEKHGIALEDLTGIRSSIRFSTKLNGRLHRWSFRKLQNIIEYKAKLRGIRVVFVDPSHTSSLCPICGVRLSPNGHRILRCECGFEADRDVVGSWNIRLKALKMWGASVPPESQPMKEGGWKPVRYEAHVLYFTG